MLSPCRELREFEFGVSSNCSHQKLDFISTITSTNIGRIIIVKRLGTIKQTNDTFWSRLDDILTDLIERPGHRNRLEVQFRGRWVGEGGGFDDKIYLPGFVRKGLVTVWSLYGKLIHSSDAPVAGGSYFG